MFVYAYTHHACLIFKQETSRSGDDYGKHGAEYVV